MQECRTLIGPHPTVDLRVERAAPETCCQCQMDVLCTEPEKPPLGLVDSSVQHAQLV